MKNQSSRNPKDSVNSKASWWHDEESRLNSRKCRREAMRGRRRHRGARKNPACWLK